jgi:2-polyprenyl-6-methoxyphenol hydroxylase-like FAD-dependent oxidoreductase
MTGPSVATSLRGLDRKPAVVVVGAGPVGLWLAAELAIGGVDVIVLDKRTERSPFSRALTVHARTLEVFAMRGIVDGWLREGRRLPTTHWAMLTSRLDLSVLDTHFPFALAIPQSRTEELIEAHARRVGVRIVRGAQVTAVREHGDIMQVDGQDVATGEAWRLQADYVVGCDGRRSIVRESVGIDYQGGDGSLSCVIGDVRVSEGVLPPATTMQTDGGSFYAVKIDDERSRLIGIQPARMIGIDGNSATLEDLRACIIAITGTDYGMHDPSWVTQLAASTYLARGYRRGRVLLAGDAAHVQFPMGGQGMNVGIQDAMNLGWRLALVTRGEASPDVLDDYGAERRPAASHVIDDTLAQTGLVAATGPEGSALREVFAEALRSEPGLNRRLAMVASGLAVSYAATDDQHPAVGCRMPDQPLRNGGNLFDRMTGGTSVSLGLDAPAAPIRVETAGPVYLEGHNGRCQLAAAVVRPDGYVLWARGADGTNEDRRTVNSLLEPSATASAGPVDVAARA